MRILLGYYWPVWSDVPIHLGTRGLIEKYMKTLNKHWSKKLNVDEKLFETSGVYRGDHSSAKVNHLLFEDAREFVFLDKFLFSDFGLFCKKEKLEESIESVFKFLKSIEFKFNPSDSVLYLDKKSFQQKESDKFQVERIEASRLEDGGHCEELQFIELDDDIIYGTYLDNKMISIASAYYSSDFVMDIGVQTLKSHRKLGAGSLAVSHLCEEILSQGYIPQYRVQKNLTGSVKIAESLGFKKILTWTYDYQED